MRSNIRKNIKGFGLIEVLVAVAIIGISMAGLMTLVNFALAVQSHLKQNLIASNLAAEAMEAAIAVKKDNWLNIGNLALEAPFYPAKSGSPLKWSLEAGQDNTNGFSREIKFSQINRDSNDDIVASGGTPDPDSRKITVLISWSEKGKNYQLTLYSYLMAW